MKKVPLSMQVWRFYPTLPTKEAFENRHFKQHISNSKQIIELFKEKSINPRGQIALFESNGPYPKELGLLKFSFDGILYIDYNNMISVGSDSSFEEFNLREFYYKEESRKEYYR